MDQIEFREPAQHLILVVQHPLAVISCLHDPVLKKGQAFFLFDHIDFTDKLWGRILHTRHHPYILFDFMGSAIHMYFSFIQSCFIRKRKWHRLSHSIFASPSADQFNFNFYPTLLLLGWRDTCCSVP